MKSGLTFRLRMSSMSLISSTSVMNVTSPISTAGRWCLAASLLLILVLCGARPSPAGQYVLPDTGQTTCYDVMGNVITCPNPGERFHGQDGNYKRTQPAFTDNGDGTVTDLNTGLMWQQGDDQNRSTRSWQDAVSYCEALDLGGYSDWRLPTVHELKSIVSYAMYNPAIDKRYFSGCKSSFYWSATSSTYYIHMARTVYFASGGGYWNGKSVTYDVRCARGGP